MTYARSPYDTTRSSYFQLASLSKRQPSMIFRRYSRTHDFRLLQHSIHNLSDLSHLDIPTSKSPTKALKGLQHIAFCYRQSVCPSLANNLRRKLSYFFFTNGSNAVDVFLENA